MAKKWSYLQGEFEVNADILNKIQNKQLKNFNQVTKYLTYDIKRLKRNIVSVDHTQTVMAQSKWAYKNNVYAGRLKSATAILGKIQYGDYHDMQHFEDKMIMMRNKKGEKLQKRQSKKPTFVL